MTEDKRLIPDAAIGTRVSESLILAAHPDERKMPDGRSLSHTRRTFVLRYDGKEAEIAITIPAPLVRAWSSASGHAYCAPLKGNYIYVYHDAKWKREIFSTTDEQITFMSGIAGADPVDDVVYLSTFGALFVRDKGKWSRHAPPSPVKRVYGTCGVSSQQVYVCSDQDLLMWDGKSFEAIEGPDDDVPTAIWATSEIIYTGGDYLNLWTEAEGWRRATNDIKDITALYSLQGQLYAGTYKKGVVKIVDGRVEPQTEDFFCLALQGVGDGVFAIAEKTCYVCENGDWRAVNLPSVP